MVTPSTSLLGDIAPLTARVKFFYGLGAVAFGIAANGFSFFLMLFYAQVLGLDAFYVGLALFIAVAIDAITDPMVGYLSDNWRSRWGRRHPFMYAAILPIAIGYIFLWMPPDWARHSQAALFGWLLALTIGVRICKTFFEIPNTALISELTSDYDARTELMGLRFMFGWWGGIGMAFLTYAVFLSEANGGLLSARGYAEYGQAGAVLMVVFMLISALGTHHTIRQTHMPPKRQHSLRQVFAELLATLRNPSLLALFGGTIFFSVASGMAAALSVYFNTFFWALTPAQLVYFPMEQIIAALCAVFVARGLGARFGKKRAALGVFVFSSLFGVLHISLRQLGIMPENGAPLLLPLLLAHNFIEVGAIITYSILMGSMLSDIVEDSALDTRRRSEGVVFAAYTIGNKMMGGLGVFATGALLSFIAFPRDASPDNVPQSVLDALALYYIIPYIGFYAIAFLIMSRYQITRDKHNANLRDLRASN